MIAPSSSASALRRSAAVQQARSIVSTPVAVPEAPRRAGGRRTTTRSCTTSSPLGSDRATAGPLTLPSSTTSLLPTSRSLSCSAAAPPLARLCPITHLSPVPTRRSTDHLSVAPREARDEPAGCNLWTMGRAGPPVDKGQSGSLSMRSVSSTPSTLASRSAASVSPSWSASTARENQTRALAASPIASWVSA